MTPEAHRAGTPGAPTRWSLTWSSSTRRCPWCTNPAGDKDPEWTASLVACSPGATGRARAPSARAAAADRRDVDTPAGQEGPQPPSCAPLYPLLFGDGAFCPRDLSHRGIPSVLRRTRPRHRAGPRRRRGVRREERGRHRGKRPCAAPRRTAPRRSARGRRASARGSRPGSAGRTATTRCPRKARRDVGSRVSVVAATGTSGRSRTRRCTFVANFRCTSACTCP